MASRISGSVSSSARVTPRKRSSDKNAPQKASPAPVVSAQRAGRPDTRISRPRKYPRAPPLPRVSTTSVSPYRSIRAGRASSPPKRAVSSRAIFSRSTSGRISPTFAAQAVMPPGHIMSR